ncbi:MAG: prepilin-type N-terminal cleavage/methylation domain-containing protein [Chloroflexota bacterium]|nr:prepilin-type N-terminal cleavage/methylation domain-containing protein [Chloroflexota bacterium]
MNSNRLFSNQRGITLLEMVIALGIAALVSSSASISIVTLMRVSGENSSHMSSLQEVQNSGYWVKRDGVKAHAVDITDNPSTPDNEYITMDWTDWDGTMNRVIYTLEAVPSGMCNFVRTHYTFDGASWNQQGILLVAEFIDDSATSRTWDGSVLTLNITAHVGDQIEARTYQTMPRPLS